MSAYSHNLRPRMPTATKGQDVAINLSSDIKYPSRNSIKKISASSDNVQSLETFTNIIYTMMGIAAVCIVVGLLSMGTRSGYMVLVLLICIGSFFLILYLAQWIIAHPDNDREMRKISDYIREGAQGFLSVQYNAIAWMAAVVAVVIFAIYLFRATTTKKVSKMTLAILTSASFGLGCLCSAFAGYIGVWSSVRVNIRVAMAAGARNYQNCFLLCFRGGALSACLSASMCILGICALYLFVHIIFVDFSGMPVHEVPVLLAGYGFGASFVALFMQLAGGIYTKAADVGADMCGKIEQNIPEDDPRNPAVIADLVGDNVGDCAGSMADVFESIAAEIIGTMILGASLGHESKVENLEAFIFFPLIIHAFDLVVSGVGIMAVRSSGRSEPPLQTMLRGYVVAMVLAVIGFVATTRMMLYTEVAPAAWWHFSGCGIVGIVTSYFLVLITKYYTDYDNSPVQSIARASKSGHGTNIIAGVGVGMESTALPIIVITIALMISYTLGKTSGLPGASAGVFGTAVATMGMLCTAVFVLSMNNFGPIADNGGGIVEMSGQGEEIREITDMLDAVGNVTKAASKGYAVGGSALACFVLFQAFLDEVSILINKPFNNIDIANIEVVVGGMLGVMTIFLFTGWSMQAVGFTAEKVVDEVRRQFRDRPGIMATPQTQTPDYNTCVAIVTKGALSAAGKPAILALMMPVIVGFAFRAIGSYTNQPLLGLEVVAGFMMFGSITGLMMAIFLDNSGGAWDNAKKLVEKAGQKGTLQHQAAVTGDTVGDPFKDTSGPSLHVIITTMSTTILVLGPLFASY
mmetsp:Transcript_11604/g.17326  ORF Transcript_11604/g.17326 Transcript_11604/m.17326 type:complete len:804 (+) Transcript_11604:63-2474(+)